MTMQSTAMRGSDSGSLGSPVSDEAYNILTALQSKLEGLEAYRTYARNGDSRIWQQLSQQDAQAVDMLLQELERLVRDGKLRARTGGSKH